MVVPAATASLVTSANVKSDACCAVVSLLRYNSGCVILFRVFVMSSLTNWRFEIHRPSASQISLGNYAPAFTLYVILPRRC